MKKSLVLSVIVIIAAVITAGSMHVGTYKSEKFTAYVFGLPSKERPKEIDESFSQYFIDNVCVTRLPGTPVIYLGELLGVFAQVSWRTSDGEWSGKRVTNIIVF